MFFAGDEGHGIREFLHRVQSAVVYILFIIYGALRIGTRVSTSVIGICFHSAKVTAIRFWRGEPL